MKKGDVGMAKRFSKSTETRDRASTTCNPIFVLSGCLSMPDATSLHHIPTSLKNKQLKLVFFQL